MKESTADGWEDFKTSSRVGDIVHGRVDQAVPFGSFVNLGNDVVGLIVLPDYPSREEGIARSLQVGMEIDAAILEFDERHRQVRLGMRADQLGKSDAEHDPMDSG